MEMVLNRLRDTVSATVYQVTSNLSTALPGNPLTREYELIRQVGSAGPSLLLKIYDATKKSTKESASLFILEKKSLERFSKKEKEFFLEAIRQGVAQLTRLRHPSMLTIQHSLEESRDLIAFATEPVIGCLANSLEDEKQEFFDVEIKYGLLQIAEGLVFLHRDAKLIHRNLCPENIIINRNGIWKIAGFEFSVQTTTPNEQLLEFPVLKVVPDISLDLQANFTYLAPECFDPNISRVHANADIFSLGMITFTLYSKGKPFLPFTSTYQYRPEKFAVDIRDKLASSTALFCIPEDSLKHIKLLLSVDESLRPDAQQLSKLTIFQDVLVRTLQYFDSLFQWDTTQKAQFYKNLPEILNKMPKRVKLRRIVSGLAKEFVNPEMVPFVLPNIIQIAKETTDEEFHTWIVPDLVPVFKYKEPIQIGIYLLQNMDFLVEKFKSNPESIREHIIPLIYRFLESEASQIQELCLSVIPSIIHLIDYTGTKNMLLPRLKKLALSTKLLSVRVNCLLCLGRILESMDKWLVLDHVLTLVMQMPSKEPAVIMSSVGIIKLALNSNKLGIPKEVLATKVIPYLVPLSIENGLTLSQYNTIMAMIREILSKIEEEHQAKLRQLDSIKVQQDSFFTDSNSVTATNTATNQSSAPFDLFELNQSLSSQKSSPSTEKPVNCMSLDEKQSLAFQREQNERLKNEKPLFEKSEPSKVSSQPKDLTSVLINANLNLMSKPVVSQASSFGDFQNHTTFQPMNNVQPMQINNVQPMNNAQQASRPNLSSLDNLCNLSQKPSQQTLNSMRTCQTSFGNLGPQFSPMSSGIARYGPQSSQPAKQLSKHELDEFLN